MDLLLKPYMNCPRYLVKDVLTWLTTLSVSVFLFPLAFIFFFFFVLPCLLSLSMFHKWVRGWLQKPLSLSLSCTHTYWDFCFAALLIFTVNGIDFFLLAKRNLLQGLYRKHIFFEKYFPNIPVFALVGCIITPLLSLEASIAFNSRRL